MILLLSVQIQAQQFEEFLLGQKLKHIIKAFLSAIKAMLLVLVPLQQVSEHQLLVYPL